VESKLFNIREEVMKRNNIDPKAYMRKKIKKSRKVNNSASQFYKTVNEKFPHLLQLLVADLLVVEGYSEADIGIGLGIGIDVVRRIAMGNTRQIPKDVFFDILGLYAGVFGNWGNYQHEESDMKC
jgi:hypothetical protein